jgi:ABC-type sugar transport system permease subunit
MAGRLHYAAAALVITLVAAVFALGVYRYADSQRAYQASQYETIAGALQLAYAVPDGTDSQILEALEGEAASLGHGGRIDRAVFVRKGKKIPTLNISKPARMVVDLGRRGGTDEEEEELVTLSARLEKHFTEGGTVATLDHRYLTWTIGTKGRRVAAWPVVGKDGYLGLAGVELLSTPKPKSPYVPALLGVLLFVGLFFCGLYFAHRREAHHSRALSDRPAAGQLLFVFLSLLALLAVTTATFLDQQERSATFVHHRDEVTTRFINRVAWQDTEGLHHLDSLWNRIFKAPAHGLTLHSLDDSGHGGAVAGFEEAGVISGLAWDRTIPVVLVVGFALLFGIFLLPGFASLLHGLVSLPGVYAYVAPAMLGMTVLVLVPFIMGVGLGFFNMDYEFVGLENFSDILFPSATSQTNFYYTLGFTILWTVSNVVLHVSLGLAMALILNNKQVRFRGLFRVLLIIPWAIPNYVTALIWKWMFTSQIGAINLMMEALGMTPINWFGPTFWTNFFAVLATNTWLGFPFMMVVSLGALQSIPNELYEAADIDGASRWQKFRNVTLPLLKPALFPAIILGTIWTFNMFNIIYLVTRGQPDNKTNILITEAYRFFAELNQYGVAAAYCVLIFFILLGYTLVTNRITRATEGAFE